MPDWTIGSPHQLIKHSAAISDNILQRSNSASELVADQWSLWVLPGNSKPTLPFKPAIPVPHLSILGAGDVHQGLGGGVDHIQQFQDGGAIIGDGGLAFTKQ